MSAPIKNSPLLTDISSSPAQEALPAPHETLAQRARTGDNWERRECDELSTRTGRAQLKKSGEPIFTPNVPIGFLLENPFAFLLAVIFDNGIVAERPWAARYELARRLGHLDPHQLVDDLPGIAKALTTPPMLQRFVNDPRGHVTPAPRSIRGPESA